MQRQSHKLTQITNMDSKGIKMTDMSNSVDSSTRTSYSNLAKARLSQINNIVNDSILDNVVSRFSFVNDHHVRGKWRTSLSVSVVAVPIVVFATAMWYQVLQTCVTGTANFPLLNLPSYSTEDTIRTFLQQEPVHYCAAAYSVLSNNDVTGGIQTVWYPCAIQNHHNSGDKYCAGYKNLINEIGNYTSHNGYCFESSDDVSNVVVFYTQCMAMTTALVNSIQAATYSIGITILLYLLARIVAKYGIAGLVSPSKWLQMLRNTKKNELWKSQSIEDV